MKKYIILLCTFIAVFIGLCVTMKVLDKKYGIDEDTYVTQSMNGQEADMLGSLKGESSVFEMGESGDVIDNPEAAFAEQIVIDAKLNEFDWVYRRNAGITNESILKAMEESVGFYAYDAMDDKYKQLYAEILLVMRGHCVAVPMSSVNANEIELVSTCVLLDHPEIFYVDGYSYDKYMFAGNVQKIVYTPNYSMDKTEVAEKTLEIEKCVSECLQGISGLNSEYEKVKYVYEYVIENTEYNLNAPNNQNICSVFLAHQSVCLGYAKAVQFILQKLGLQCAVVTGFVSTGEAHAWNLVRIDSHYYYVDATWGDASYLSDMTMNTLTSTNYDYLCITTDDLQKTHTTDYPLTLPFCTSMIHNYYVKEGLYLQNLDGLTLKSVFDEEHIRGGENLSIRCANRDVYERVQTELLDGQQIFKYLGNGTSALSYTSNDILYTYTFLL